MIRTIDLLIHKLLGQEVSFVGFVQKSCVQQTYNTSEPFQEFFTRLGR